MMKGCRESILDCNNLIIILIIWFVVVKDKYSLRKGYAKLFFRRDRVF